MFHGYVTVLAACHKSLVSFDLILKCAGRENGGGDDGGGNSDQDMHAERLYQGLVNARTTIPGFE